MVSGHIVPRAQRHVSLLLPTPPCCTLLSMVGMKVNMTALSKLLLSFRRAAQMQARCTAHAGFVLRVALQFSISLSLVEVIHSSPLFAVFHSSQPLKTKVGPSSIIFQCVIPCYLSRPCAFDPRCRMCKIGYKCHIIVNHLRCLLSPGRCGHLIYNSSPVYSTIFRPSSVGQNEPWHAIAVWHNPHSLPS